MVSGEGWKVAHWVCVIQYSVSHRVVKGWVGEREVASTTKPTTAAQGQKGKAK